MLARQLPGYLSWVLSGLLQRHDLRLSCCPEGHGPLHACESQILMLLPRMHPLEGKAAVAGLWGFYRYAGERVSVEGGLAGWGGGWAPQGSQSRWSGPGKELSSFRPTTGLPSRCKTHTHTHIEQ